MPRCSPLASASPGASSASAKAGARSRASRPRRARPWTVSAASGTSAMGGTESHRAGFVALGGRPNVGKSTLLNCLVGQKVAIVTPRPQTTRRRILGIRSDPDAQLIFIDTPGLHRPRTALDQRMVEVARRCLREGEVVVGVVEARGQLDPGDREFLAELRELKAPRIIAINKLDLVSRADLIACAEQCSRELPEAEI